MRYGWRVMPSFPQASHKWLGLPIHVYLVALITRKSLQQLKSDLLKMIAMSSGASKLFVQAYMSYCSWTRTPERHRYQPKRPCTDAFSYKLLIDLCK